MTPPEHFLIGLSTASAFYAAEHFVKPLEKKPVGYGKLLCVMGLAAILPDMDSFWGTYTSKNPWIGHRGMTHSFVGVAVIGLGLAILSALISLILRVIPAYWHFWHDHFKRKEFGTEKKFHLPKYLLEPFHWLPFSLVFLAAFLGGVTHILADLPQAKSAWGGLPIYFPFKSGGDYARVGGFGLVGWYDFRIGWALIGAAVISIPAVFLGMFLKWFKNNFFKVTVIAWFALVFAFNAGLYVWIVNHVRHSTYVDDRTWYDSQMKWVASAPKLIREPTQEAFKIGVSLFQQSQRL